MRRCLLRLRLLVLCAALALAACETASDDDRQDAIDARTALVGMSKSDLLSCAGPPDRSARDGDLEVLSYSAERLVRGHSRSGATLGFGSYGTGIILPLGNDRGDPATVTSCRARFTLRNGVVEQLSYVEGTYGAQRLSDCGRLIRPCLDTVRTVPREPATERDDPVLQDGDDDWQDYWKEEPQPRSDWESDW